MAIVTRFIVRYFMRIQPIFQSLSNNTLASCTISTASQEPQPSHWLKTVATVLWKWNCVVWTNPALTAICDMCLCGKTAFPVDNLTMRMFIFTFVTESSLWKWYRVFLFTDGYPINLCMLKLCSIHTRTYIYVSVSLLHVSNVPLRISYGHR